MTRKELMAALEERGIGYDRAATKSELEALLDGKSAEAKTPGDGECEVVIMCANMWVGEGEMTEKYKKGSRVVMSRDVAGRLCDEDDDMDRDHRVLIL